MRSLLLIPPLLGLSACKPVLPTGPGSLPARVEAPAAPRAAELTAPPDEAPAEPAALEIPPAAASVDPESLSKPLSCGLHNPMPGSFTAGYPLDTGLDLAGIKLPVFAMAAGRVLYAEAGHSRWSARGDTDLAVLIRLDDPIAFGERSVTHIWYAHLSKLEFEQERMAMGGRRVVAGEPLGVSGVANGSWHLHLGLLLDNDVSQRSGSFLGEEQARQVLCGLRPRQRLPR